MKIVLTALCLACLSTVAVAEKYPQGMQLGSRPDALRACNTNSQLRWRVGTASDYERDRRADYSTCMFRRGHSD
jgi:hypothetical protein